MLTTSSDGHADPPVRVPMISLPMVGQARYERRCGTEPVSPTGRGKGAFERGADHPGNEAEEFAPACLQHCSACTTPRVVLLNSVAAEPLRTIAHRVIARSSGAESWVPAVLRQALAAAPLSLFLHQRPDAIPVGTWGGDAELCDALRNSLLGASQHFLDRPAWSGTAQASWHSKECTACPACSHSG